MKNFIKRLCISVLFLSLSFVTFSQVSQTEKNYGYFESTIGLNIPVGTYASISNAKTGAHFNVGGAVKIKKFNEQYILQLRHGVFFGMNPFDKDQLAEKEYISNVVSGLGYNYAGLGFGPQLTIQLNDKMCFDLAIKGNLNMFWAPNTIEYTLNTPNSLSNTSNSLSTTVIDADKNYSDGDIILSDNFYVSPTYLIGFRYTWIYLGLELSSFKIVNERAVFFDYDQWWGGSLAFTEPDYEYKVVSRATNFRLMLGVAL